MPRLKKLRTPPSRGAESAPLPVLESFQLIPYYRNVPDQQLLSDLRAVARRLSTRSLTKSLYKRHGLFDPNTPAKRFGSWNTALTTAGLRPARNQRIPANIVLADLRRVAKKLHVKKLTADNYRTVGKYSLAPFLRHFHNWQTAVTSAGLTPGRYHATSDTQLFDNLEHVWRTLGRQPRSEDLIRPLSKFGRSTYRRRFGGLHQALKAFVTQINSHPAKSPPHPLTKSPPPPITHKTPRTINWRLRFLTLRRDHFRCRACGGSPASDSKIRLQVDHIVPWSRGGETIPSNLQSLCEACNGGKGELTWREGRRRVASKHAFKPHSTVRNGPFRPSLS